jgi:uncharacterized protein
MPNQNVQKEWDEDVEEVSEIKTKNKMPRPCKQRRIRGKPNSSHFKPAGIPRTELKEIILDMPEFEVIRLIDLEEIAQEQASKQMKISQPTLSRILKSARKKISDAIINGKSIKIKR